MTLTLSRPQEARLPHHQPVPDTYRLLSVFSGIPLAPLEALERSGLKEPGRPATDAIRGVLRTLRDQGLVRWVTWAEPDAQQEVLRGYVLTGTGEALLSTYFDRYGPPLTPHRTPERA